LDTRIGEEIARFRAIKRVTHETSLMTRSEVLGTCRSTWYFYYTRKKYFTTVVQ